MIALKKILKSLLALVLVILATLVATCCMLLPASALLGGLSYVFNDFLYVFMSLALIEIVCFVIYKIVKWLVMEVD